MTTQTRPNTRPLTTLALIVVLFGIGALGGSVAGNLLDHGAWIVEAYVRVVLTIIASLAVVTYIAYLASKRAWRSAVAAVVLTLALCALVAWAASQ